MKLIRSTMFAVLALTITAATSAQAQRRVAPTFAAAFSSGSLANRGYQQRYIVLGEVSAGFRVRAGQYLSLLTTGFAAERVFSDAGSLNCPITSSGGCQASFPDVHYYGVAFGAEVRLHDISLDVLGGPASYVNDGVIQTNTRDARHTGSLARVDANFFAAQHFAFVISAVRRNLAHFIPPTTALNGYALGFRVQ